MNMSDQFGVSERISKRPDRASEMCFEDVIRNPDINIMGEISYGTQHI